jgi:hypothetical protein
MAVNDLGFDNLLWFMGVVEDNNDPQMLGRCKVRAFGLHPPDKTLVPTEDLPWAWMISGTYNAAVVPPAPNTWVFGFFLDGKNAQHPMLMGVMMGMPTSPPSTDPNQGFSSAGNGNGQSYPSNPACATMFQPDMSNLARGENLHNTGVALANAMTGDGSPPSAYGAQYPHNWVHETRGGHAFELDDTPGNERVNLSHVSGSRVEMDNRGNVVIKSPGDNWVSVDRNGWIRTGGSWDVRAKGSIRIHAENDLNISCDGNLTTTVHGNYNINVAGDFAVNAGGTNKTRAAEHTLQATSGSVHLDAAGIIQARSNGNLYLESDVDININANAGGIYANAADDMSFSTEANFEVLATGEFGGVAGEDVRFSGSNVHLSGSSVFIDDVISMANGDASPPAGAATDAAAADAELGQTQFPEPPVRKQPVTVSLRSYPVAGAATATDDTDNSYGPQ